MSASKAHPDGEVLGPVEPSPSANTVLRPAAQAASAIESGFWARRQAANRETSIPLGYQRLEEHGNFENFRLAAAGAKGGYQGPVFNDSDVYKWLEAVAWEQGRLPSQELAGWQSEVTALVAAAQAPDGYLDTYFQLTGQPERRYTDLTSGHELYCAGHLMQAAVAQRRAGASDGLLAVATRVADHLVATFGPGGREGVPGHPEVEMALVEMARTLNRADCLDLAATFIDRRGYGTLPLTTMSGAFYQDEVPVRKAATVVGHAVRALYLNSGATDVMIEKGDDTLAGPLSTQWRSMVDTKSYLTGGVGARWEGESFGDPFELPPDRAYAETCAAIAAVQWSWRMLLATGEAAYADVIERTLYNAVLPGVSDSGSEFAYVNPLQVRSGAEPDSSRSPVGGRHGWFGTACCPANVMRTIASLQHYLLTSSPAGLQLHQFAPGRLAGPVDGGRAELRVATAYPWDGTVEAEVAAAPGTTWELSIRIPAWCADPSLSVNGTPAGAALRPGGYASLARQWRAGDQVMLTLPMPARVTTAHPRIDAVRGCVALERGPLVYCFEAADAPPGVNIDDLALAVGADVREVTSELFGGSRLIETAVAVPHPAPVRRPLYSSDTVAPASFRTFVMRAVPYFAWANREVGPMRVWLPRA